MGASLCFFATQECICTHVHKMPFAPYPFFGPSPRSLFDACLTARTHFQHYVLAPWKRKRSPSPDLTTRTHWRAGVHACGQSAATFHQNADESYRVGQVYERRNVHTWLKLLSEIRLPVMFRRTSHGSHGDVRKGVPLSCLL